ncbi:hypothetical protein E2C01_002581 [Portunus trituberculatus]|uniref:Uncharacterized protein n=1 Tax=Portunus trituberculatus TaxID=210409 RepID=A0A5B7CKR4_PORTR|nr:hypothetical protein [Portunus trituberculatus]
MRHHGFLPPPLFSTGSSLRDTGIIASTCRLLRPCCRCCVHSPPPASFCPYGSCFSDRPSYVRPSDTLVSIFLI